MFRIAYESPILWDQVGPDRPAQLSGIKEPQAQHPV